ncbi:flippase [Erythrobacter sp. HL-111]|uniref:flippase n=1 Tax=Erythrobacter sp. HL-111 TaxID=1798193 RepID=UPI0006DB8AD2|nr:flippase [Erythrobacter sp. HL-111]KPP94402.1 MAG: Membrane protein involved in the export of O-antigen and teichoic acid [Erythrobacteraceae bacterium HL-111]SDS54812.1 Membrane protein involved in the export of O-antigen and teichoic acid [Erythrobacter sp. HL-111]
MALARNSFLSLAPTVAGVVVSIVTIPLYISLAGAERYGALLIAWVLLGYFGQADFGLGRAITQRLSATREAAPAHQAEIVWSALFGASLIAGAGAVLVYLSSNLFFGSFFEADAGLQAEALASTWLFALCVPVIMYTGVSAGALVGVERFGVVSIGTTLGNILSQILPLVVAVSHSVELSWLLGASLCGRMIGLIPILASMWAVFLRGHRVNPSLAQLRPLFSFGAWIMLTAMVSPLMTMSDRVVIGAVIGTAAVVAYSVPFQIAQRTVMFPLAMVQALFPRFASQSPEQAAALGKDAVIIVGQWYGLVVIGLICLAEPLLRLWLGDELDPRSILVGRIILVGCWANAIASVPYAHIHARGNSRFTALAHLVELPIYFAMLYGFGSLFGLAGVALAYSLRTSIDCVVMLVKARFNAADLLRKLMAPAALIAVALAVSPYAADWVSGLAAASILAGILLPVCWMQMPGEARRALAVRFNQ